MSENSRNLEAGLLLRKNQNDINECRITAVVLFSTFVSVCGSFCFGCAVSHQITHLFFKTISLFVLLCDLKVWGWILQAGYSSVAQTGIINDLGLSVAQVRSNPLSFLESLLKKC